MNTQPSCLTNEEQKKIAYSECLSRRRFLVGAVAFLFGVKCVNDIDHLLASERWPDDVPEIIIATGGEKIKQGGEEWLVFGGFGQKYSVNAAQELFNEINQRQVVASIKYPNQGFTVDALGQIVAQHIKDRKMSTLNIVGASMGCGTALATIADLCRKIADRPLDDAGDDALCVLPEIRYIAGYSSPADTQDAFDGELAPWVADLCQKTGYQPAVMAKLLYSLFDGDGDKHSFFQINNRKQWFKYLRNSIEQTFNDCPPRLALSQIQLLSSFNFIKQYKELQVAVTPGNTRFVYCRPSGNDKTVDNASAIQKYQAGFLDLSVTTTILDTGPTGHANTVASAQALGSLVMAQG